MAYYDILSYIQNELRPWSEVEVNKEKQKKTITVDIIIYQGKSFENDS